MNKDVCRKCYIDNVLGNPSIRKVDTYWTLEDFDKYWEIGCMCCPHHMVFPAATRPGTWSVNKEMAFKHCPKKFEHAIADAAESVNIDTNK
jgi:hypothetical protein